LRARTLRRLRWLLPNRGQTGFSPTELPPPPPAAGSGAPDYLVWAVIDWHFRLQRPQHLAREISKAGRRVFYVSCNLIDDPAPGFRIEPLDSKGCLYQVFLKASGAPAIYFEEPSRLVDRQLKDGMRMLMEWAKIDDTVSLIEHPFWFGAAREASPGRLIHDRMDFHEGFETFSKELVVAEQDLMRAADLTIVSSEWLDQDTARYTDRRLLLRNAGEYTHFCEPPGNVYRDPEGRRVIGYYGALAGWMDLNLVAAIATSFADCLILLIGHDQYKVAKKLTRFRNVRLPGEVPYAELSRYLHGFDVCILPFRKIPLTLATNPVKVYEYLSAGKPVVAVDLPEMEQFGDLVILAGDESEFLSGIAICLEERCASGTIDRRRAFAKNQTWSQRAATLMASVESRSADLSEQSAS